MVIVPSVDVRAGRVAYRGGVGADQDPRALAQDYVAQGAEELHLVDLDGAERGEYANFELLAGIARDAGVPCRLAGGIASLEQARAASEAGFAGVLFSSAAFGDENVLRRASQLSGAIVEIEARDGQLDPRGGPHELVLLAKGMDARLAARVASLRRVLGAAAIRTVPGFGYRLELEVVRPTPAGRGQAVPCAGPAPRPVPARGR